MKPYDWKRHRPDVEIRRPEVAGVAEALREALQLASGGNPALVTYGLGELWQRPRPSERDVVDAFVEFRQRHSEFLRDVQLSFTEPRLSDAPRRILDLNQQSDGELSHEALQAACSGSEGLLELDSSNVLDLLEAAGLVRVTGSALADPVLVGPVSSVLTLPSAPVAGGASSRAPLRSRLRQDLTSNDFAVGDGSQGAELPAPCPLPRRARCQPSRPTGCGGPDRGAA